MSYLVKKSLQNNDKPCTIEEEEAQIPQWAEDYLREKMRYLMAEIQSIRKTLGMEPLPINRRQRKE
jgi:hypothetical protein